MSNEYEREPVPARARLGFRSFIGQYAGEHTAGTELMIGPLFVAAGVSAFDLLGRAARRQPARGTELDVPDGAHRHARAAHALLPARTDLRPPAGDALQPRQRRDVLLARRVDDHRIGDRARRVVRVRDAAAERRLSHSARLGPRRPRHRRAGHGRRGLSATSSSRASPTSPRPGWCWCSSRLAWSAFASCGVDVARRSSGSKASRRDLERRRPAARPGQVHLLARHVLRLVLQHGDAHRHGRPLGASLREAVLVRHLHAPRACFSATISPGLPPRSSTSLQLQGRPDQHRRAPRPAGLQRLRHRRGHLRDRGRMDDGQPDDLSRGPRVPGDHAARVAVSGHVGDRRDHDHRRRVSRPSPCSCSTSSRSTACC